MWGQKFNFKCTQCGSERNYVYDFFKVFATRCILCRGITETRLRYYEAENNAKRVTLKWAKIELGLLRARNVVSSGQAQTIQFFLPFVLPPGIEESSEDNQNLMDMSMRSDVHEKSMELVMKGEGYSSTVHKDKEGNRIIGYNHKLLPEDIMEEVTKEEARDFLEQDLRKATTEIENHFGKEMISNMGALRVSVLVEMAVQLGSVRWPNLDKALKAQDYDQAAKQIQFSKYGKQNKARTKSIVLIMQTGTMQTK